jgi:hypothetical protein
MRRLAPSRNSPSDLWRIGPFIPIDSIGLMDNDPRVEDRRTIGAMAKSRRVREVSDDVSRSQVPSVRSKSSALGADQSAARFAWWLRRPGRQGEPARASHGSIDRFTGGMVSPRERWAETWMREDHAEQCPRFKSFQGSAHRYRDADTDGHRRAARRTSCRTRCTAHREHAGLRLDHALQAGSVKLDGHRITTLMDARCPGHRGQRARIDAGMPFGSVGVSLTPASPEGAWRGLKRRPAGLREHS